MPLQEALEKDGHVVTWDGATAEGPVAGTGAMDVVVLDGESESCLVGAVAWRNHDPPPGLLVTGQSDAGRARATQSQCGFVPSSASAAELGELVAKALKFRFAGRMSGNYARAVLGLSKAGDKASNAIRIVSAAREVDLDLVRECLRWHGHEYVTANDLVKTLREHRALQVPEIEIVNRLDGTQTVQRLVSAPGGDGIRAGRLLWALLSADVAACGKEPPDERTPGRKAVASLRRHLRARHARLKHTTHYDVLEVTQDANPQRVDYAARVLATRFSPDRLRSLDLGDLASLVGPLWQQVLLARQVLMDPSQRTRYDSAINQKRDQLKSPWAFEVQDAERAEDAFRRGQAALIEGEAFKAVSGIATACRNHPDHPDYEASLCWARYRAELARGGDRGGTISKERATAEAALIGRRPWPRALLALALLSAADGDSDAARWHLQEALTIEPNLPAAKQLLGRLS